MVEVGVEMEIGGAEESYEDVWRDSPRFLWSPWSLFIRSQLVACLLGQAIRPIEFAGSLLWNLISDPNLNCWNIILSVLVHSNSSSYAYSCSVVFFDEQKLINLYNDEKKLTIETAGIVDFYHGVSQSIL